jgi:hypothetical protein
MKAIIIAVRFLFSSFHSGRDTSATYSLASLFLRFVLPPNKKGGAHVQGAKDLTN